MFKGPWTRWLALLLLALLLGGCDSMPTRTEQHTDNRLAKLQAGNTGLLALLPAVASAKQAVQLGDGALRAGKREEALLYYVRAVELDPKDYTSLYKIGLIHGDLGNFQLASLAYQMALNVNPDYAPAQEDLGLLFLKHRKPKLAEKHLKRAIALDPQLWRSQNALGVLADMRGDFATAKSYYHQAFAVQPNSPLLLSNLGYSYYLSGDLKRAEYYFRQSLALNPTFYRARYNLALVYVKRKDYSEALQLLSEQGSKAAAYNDLGYICMLQGDYARAEQYLEEAVYVSPTYYRKAERNLMRLHELQRAAASK